MKNANVSAFSSSRSTNSAEICSFEPDGRDTFEPTARGCVIAEGAGLAGTEYDEKGKECSGSGKQNSLRRESNVL